MRFGSLKKALIGAAVIVGSTAAVIAPAGAVDGDINPNPIVIDRQLAIDSGGFQDQAASVRALFDLTITGATPNTNQFVDICFKNPLDADFLFVAHCGGSYGTSVISDASGNASRTGSAGGIFIYGLDYASETWGFFADDDANLPAVQDAYGDIPIYNSGWIRIADGERATSDPTKIKAIPFTVELSEGGGPDPVVPESPVTILLPVAGVLVAIGGFVLVRRRQAIA
jgi:hypothetical protein